MGWWHVKPKLVQYANTLLKHTVLFGSDNPVILPDRWLTEFDKLPIKPEAKPLIIKESAARLLKLREALDRLGIYAPARRVVSGCHRFQPSSFAVRARSRHLRISVSTCARNSSAVPLAGSLPMARSRLRTASWLST